MRSGRGLISSKIKGYYIMLDIILIDPDRHANADELPALSMVHLGAAVGRVQHAIINFADRHLQYLNARQEYQNEVLTRTDKTQPLPPKPRPPAPLGVIVTTGVGKTKGISEILNSATDIPFFILLKNHKLAAELAVHINEDVEVLKYSGRSADKESEAHCQKSDVVLKLGAQRRLVQPLLCQSCEHGMRTMLDRYRSRLASANSPKARSTAEDKIDGLMNKAKNLQIDILAHAPCVWLDHQLAALSARVVIGTHDSYGPTLALYDGQPRLIIVDEAAALARGWTVEIKHVTEWTSRIKEERNRTTAKLIERNLLSNLMGDDGEQAQEIRKEIKDLQRTLEALSAGENFLKATKVWLSESIKAETDTDVYPAPEIITSACAIEKIQTIQDSAVPWERASMRAPNGGEQIVPLRSAIDLAWAIRNGTAYAKNGAIFATSLTGLGAALVGGHHSIILMDATMPKSTADAILQLGGKVERINSRQNIKIVQYQDRAHLRGCFINPEHPERAKVAIAKEKKRLAIAKAIMAAEVGQEEFGVITHQPLSELADGYWGRDEIGMDHMGGQHLLLFGDPVVHPYNLRSEYESNRAVAIAAGCDASSWPRWSDAGRTRPLVRVSSTRSLISKMSLPADPYIRDWALAFFTSRFIQAVGRVRGARADDTRIIHVWAGLPIDWRQIGIEVEIRDDPVEAGKKRGGGDGGAQPINAQAGEFLLRLSADMKTLVLAGKTPGRRNIEELRGSGINPGRFQRDRSGALMSALVEIGDGELAREMSTNPDALKAGWIAGVAEAAFDEITGA